MPRLAAHGNGKRPAKSGPNRVSTQTIEGKTRKAWLANDFTLAEIKTLDAGSWFDKKFAAERVPTFDEAVALVRGRAGLFPELKTPEIYEGRDVKFEEQPITSGYFSCKD